VLEALREGEPRRAAEAGAVESPSAAGTLKIRYLKPEFQGNGIADERALLAHPRSGASWEAFALEQMLRIAAPDEAWFWATHAGAELTCSW
jgi:GNAT superfamily N-acetyltransferase